MDKCQELKQQMLVLPQVLCYDSRYYSLPAPKLIGNFAKILAKKRYCYYYVLILLHFMLVLLPVTLYLMYSISSFPKIQNIRRDPELRPIHCCCMCIKFQILVKFLPERIEGLDCVVWFCFVLFFNFILGGGVGFGGVSCATIVLIKILFHNLNVLMAVEVESIFIDGVPMTSLLHLG